MENGKFLLIGSGKRKNEFFKFCFPGIKVFIISFDYLKFASLFRCDIAVNGFTEFRKLLFQTFVNKRFKVKGSICGFSKSLSSMAKADLPKVSETTFPNWILENERQFCKRFFSLNIKQVSLKR